MTSRMHRRFSIADGMILIAAVAVGSLIGRASMPGFLSTLLSTPFDGPARSRGWTRPGVVALAMATILEVMGFVLATFRWSCFPPSFVAVRNALEFRVRGAIAGAWIMQGLSDLVDAGPRRSRPTRASCKRWSVGAHALTRWFCNALGLIRRNSKVGRASLPA